MKQSELHFRLVQYISRQMVLTKLNEIEPYHLCFWHSYIDIYNVQHTLILHPIFHTFTSQQVHHGCTPAELVKITKPIIDFLIERPECLKQFKL